MDIGSVLSLLQTALELGLISSLVVLALFLSYSMLNVCFLSTDGCFTLGAAVGATVAISGHPYLAIPAAMGAGVLSGAGVSLPFSANAGSANANASAATSMSAVIFFNFSLTCFIPPLMYCLSFRH